MNNQKIIGVLVGGILIGGTLGAGVTLSLNKKKAGSSGGEFATCSVDGVSHGAIFELNGKTYGKLDLPADAQDSIYQFEMQGFEGTSNLAKETALRIKLFQDANKGKEADLSKLPKLQDLLSGGKVTEEEMKSFYEANKNRIPPGMTYEQVKPQLEQFMMAQKVGGSAREKIAELEKSGEFKLLLQPPEAAKVDLDLKGYPTKGNESSNVTVVEVSDYLCPHCRAVKSEVDQMVKDLGSKVKFVQVNFALHQDGLSGALARGGVCALQQGNDAFWKFHEKAFEISPEAATPVSTDAAKEFNEHAIKLATDAGLDAAKFSTCITAPETAESVKKTNDTFSAAGVNGTPTFFINNRKTAVAGGGALKKAVEDAIAAN